MRGSDKRSSELFSYVDLEDRIPEKHPLRLIRTIVNEVLATLNAEFAALYAGGGRPSIAPERLLRASLLQAFYSIRSERQLMEQLDYNLLYRWFVGLGVDDAVWDHSTFSKNRDRLLEADVSAKFLEAVLAHPKVKPLECFMFLWNQNSTLSLCFCRISGRITAYTYPGNALLSDEHFSVDGTLVEAWALSCRRRASSTMKSFRPKDDCDDGDGENFHGSKRKNDTHASTTDPDARLYRKGKGKEAKLCYMGHALMENRSGFVVEAELTHADGYGERKAALAMLHRHAPGTRKRTLGGDKGYDVGDFVADLRQMCVTPHVARKTKGSAIDGRTTRHIGYEISQRIRKRIEEPFGWGKAGGGGIRKVKVRGLKRVGAVFKMTMAAYNLSLLPRLLKGAT